MMDNLYGMMGYGPFGYSSFGFLFMLLFLVAIVWLIVWAIKEFTRNKSESALDILKKRFARGEITKKEYEGMKKKL